MEIYIKECETPDVGIRFDQDKGDHMTKSYGDGARLEIKLSWFGYAEMVTQI